LGRMKQANKIVALPTSLCYEPWTLDLPKQIRSNRKLSFDMTENRVNQIVKENLGSFPRIHTHSLRHFRATHLVSQYNFDPYYLSAYCGWSFRTGFGNLGMPSGELDVYLHLQWRRISRSC